MSASNLNRYLTVRILYPKSERREDILGAVRQVSAAARKFEGLVEIGAWLDEENDRVLNISLWESKGQAMHAASQMHADFAHIPWGQWERKPADNFLNLQRVI